jgi:hypothetical protein
MNRAATSNTFLRFLSVVSVDNDDDADLSSGNCGTTKQDVRTEETAVQKRHLPVESLPTASTSSTAPGHFKCTCSAILKGATNRAKKAAQDSELHVQVAGQAMILIIDRIKVSARDVSSSLIIIHACHL